MPFIEKVQPPHPCKLPQIRHFEEDSMFAIQLIGEGSTWECDVCGSVWKLGDKIGMDDNPSILWRCIKRIPYKCP